MLAGPRTLALSRVKSGACGLDADRRLPGMTYWLTKERQEIIHSKQRLKTRTAPTATSFGAALTVWFFCEVTEVAVLNCPAHDLGASGHA